MSVSDTTADAIATAETLLDHRFARGELLREALTHRSAVRPRRGRSPGSNERLEFIGDRVLGLLTAEWLLERFPDEPEGALGPRLAHLVSRDTLAGVAAASGLAGLIRVGTNEGETGVARLSGVMADAVEALLGALYLDAGLDAARRFMRRAWHDAMVAQRVPPKDAKTALQEHLLARGLGLPVYAVRAVDGPSHAPRFVVSAAGGGGEGVGEAGSKQAAERLAATDLLAKLTADAPATPTQAA